MKKTLLLALLPVTVLLLLGATGTLYKGKFVDGGYSPAFIGDGSGLSNLNVQTLNISNSSVFYGPVTFTNTFTTYSYISNLYATNLYSSNAYFQFLSTSNAYINNTYTTNLYVISTFYPTNHAAVTTLALNNNYQDFATNNNVAYTGFTFAPGDTNLSWASVICTNTSGSLKTITFAGCIGDSTAYVTNQTAFTVLRHPKRGTNVVARSLN